VGRAVHRERFRSELPGGTTWHSFSFGSHYDPANTSFGPLLLHDEHVLDPGAGFDEHLHRDLEVVSWVLDGVLVHEGPGGRRELGPGSAQRLRAGSGALHAERAGDVPTRFVQAWLLPDQRGLPPADEALVLPDAALADRLVTVAGPGGLALATRGAALRVARLSAGGSVRTAGAHLEHVFVGRGQVEVAGLRLAAGDSLRSADDGPLLLVARERAELLVWEMDITTRT
jgi:redox-sensitive bicupin YhaK (pirin superfamily)